MVMKGKEITWLRLCSADEYGNYPVNNIGLQIHRKNEKMPTLAWSNLLTSKRLHTKSFKLGGEKTCNVWNIISQTSIMLTMEWLA